MQIFLSNFAISFFFWKYFKLNFIKIVNLVGYADIDECSSSPCDLNSNCHNSDGTYSCTCHDGFVSPSNSGANCQGKLGDNWIFFCQKQNDKSIKCGFKNYQKIKYHKRLWTKKKLKLHHKSSQKKLCQK